MKWKFIFLTLFLTCFACGTSSNYGKTYYENRNSNELMRDHVIDGVLGNNPKIIVNEPFETNDNKLIPNEITPQEIKELLKLSPEQAKQYDLLLKKFETKKSDVVNSLSLNEDEKIEKIERLSKNKDEQIKGILDEYQANIYGNLLNQNSK